MNDGLLLDGVLSRLATIVGQADDRAIRLCHLASPESIAHSFGSSGVPLEVSAGEPAYPATALLRAIDAAIAHSVRTLHPRFFNQNFAAADLVSVLGDWLGAALNTTMATYEAAPVFTLMERALLARLAQLAGWTNHEGILMPGGSLSNLTAMHLAHLRLAPNCIDEGHDGRRYVAFTSNHSHYSLAKAASLLGLGRRNVVGIDCDSHGRMQAGALDEAIIEARRQSAQPFFVNATAGTTVLGAFDPIGAVADVCAKHGLWLHVDAAFGGAALVSPRQRPRLSGVERADSLAWNLHKMLGVTQQCAALLVRSPGQLQAAFATGATYLFQPDKPHAGLDSGDRTFQCARRVDALKAWLLWKGRGEEALAARVDRAVDLAEQCARKIAADPRFALSAPPSWVNVCFWWIPPRWRPFRERTASLDAAWHGLAPRIKERMLAAGETMVSYQPIDGGPNCFRLLFMNPAVREEDVDFVLDSIDRYGRELENGPA